MSLMPKKSGWKLRPALALAPVAAAYVLQALLWWQIAPLLWIFFYPAVFCSAWIGGGRWGLAATVASVGLVWSRFVPAGQSLDFRLGLQTAVFVGTGGLFSLIVGKLQRARELSEARVRASTAELEATAQDLRQSKAYLQTVTDTARVGLVIVDARLRYRLANRMYRELLGLPEMDMIGKTVAEVVPGLFETQIRPRLERALAGEAVGFQLYLPDSKRSGQARCLAVSYAPLLENAERAVVVTLADVTASNRSDEVAARLAAIVESSTDAIIGKNLDGIITSWNKGAELLLGYTAEEMVGQPVLRLIPADRQDEEEFILGRIRRGEVVRPFETVRLHKDGHGIDLSIAVSPIRDSAGRIIGASKVARDITESKRVQLNLRESEERLRLALDAAQLGMWERNFVTNRLTWSEREERMMGFAPGTFAGTLEAFRALVHPEDLPRLAAAQERALQGGGHYQAELRFILPDGRARWGFVRGQVFFDAAGRPERMLGIELDITERKLAEEALRASEARFQQLVENMREVFWMSDVAKQKVLYVSPGYAEVWGRPCEELYRSSLTWAESIHADDRARVIGAAATQQAAGTYDETYRIVRPDGAIRWIRDRAFPVRDKRGVVERIVGVADDITERRKLEEQFLRAQRLEAIGTLSSGIAHDLNNILAPMMMVAPLLRDSLTSPHDLELLGMIEQGAQRGANIIKQLLAFSRGVDGDRGPLQVRHLVKEMCALMAETFPREIAIKSDLAPELWPVLADATQLHQVFLNLCVNARDAMSHGGCLTVEARNVTLTAVDAGLSPDARPGTYVVVGVEDTGHGIAPEIIGRIFEPFFTTKEIGRGTGLGLSTVMGIVRSHGGFLTVSSQPGVGTKFETYLPASAHAEEAGAADADATTLMGAGELVLVVDDEEPIRSMTRRFLEQYGYRVVCAANGRDALAVLRNQPGSVRLLLTDVMMPVMGGVELIRRALELAPTLRVIASSGLNDPERTSELAALGVHKILPKPCDPHVLLGVIHAELRTVG
jgi:PAS domain S-box-containing protein